MSELEEKINKLSPSQKADAILYYLSDNRYNRAVAVLEKTIDDFIDYLEDTNIVDELHDGKDKTFDRGKVIVKDLLELTETLEKAKMSPLNVKVDTTVKSTSKPNSIMNIMQEMKKQN